jgi:hypothetical protein
MSCLHMKKSLLAAGCILGCLAGCDGPGGFRTQSVRGSAMAASPTSAAMPSYPILLVDLPRQQMGQAVQPARSRLPLGAERDMDLAGPVQAAGTTTRVPPALTASPVAPPVRAVPFDARLVP